MSFKFRFDIHKFSNDAPKFCNDQTLNFKLYGYVVFALVYVDRRTNKMATLSHLELLQRYGEIS